MIKMTLVVESNEHGGGDITMTRTESYSGDNPRYYSSEARHLGVKLVEWVSTQMSSLVNGFDLTARGALVVVEQESLDALERRSARLQQVFDDMMGKLLVDGDEFSRLKQRDALLSRMESAGVDNWEGMDNLGPEDDETPASRED